MMSGWLPSVVPESFMTARTRVWWLLFLSLFPLAYVAGILLLRAEERSNQMASHVDRDAAIRIAETFASSQGINVAGWNRYLIVETDENLLAYYGYRRVRNLNSETATLPARQVQVVLRPSGGKRELRVWLSLAGRVIQYDLNDSSAGKGDHTPKSSGDASQQQNDAIARRALADAGFSQFLTFGPPVVKPENEDRRTQFSWDLKPPDQPELNCQLSVGLRDGVVISRKVKATVSEDYAKAHLRSKATFPEIFNSIFGLFLTVGAFYAVYRYARRSLQKEVSHRRSLVVALVFSLSFGILSYSFATDQIAAKLSGVIFEKLTIVFASVSSIVYLSLGLLVGIAYGSGEGEVREAYPGKLTSLDALLAGRILSKNVGASVLFGAAFAGWLLLIHYAIAYFLRTDQMSTQSQVLSYTFARLPWLTLLLGKQYHALLIAVAGLLVPASFLLRKTRSRKSPFFWLVAFALCSVLQAAATFPTLPAALLAAIILAAALLVPFFLFDLLAAMVSISALQYVDELARLSAVFPSWMPPAAFMMIVAAATLVVALYLTLRGRAVYEEDVRPRYAKYLAERIALQAEVSAAREAQLRLLPQMLPEIAGLSFAACCLPARIVGGDFYDFFELDPHTVGIFVAEGGNQGLASALCIALAKGVLMHKVHQGCSPTEILVQVENMLSDLLESGYGKATFGYAVFDTWRGVVRYACTGTSPKLLLYRGPGLLVPTSQLERTAVIPGRSDSAKRIREGNSMLLPGDQLIFFTGGVAAQVPRRFSKRESEWIGKLLESLSHIKQPLQNALHGALSKFKSSEDLTAVLIRVSAVQARTKEGVA